MSYMKDAFADFANLFKKRVNAGKTLTEDTVRYLFFHSLTDYLDPNDLTLECPHPWLKGKEIDLTIGEPISMALETKFHRNIPSGKTQPRTQKFGEIVADLIRLNLLGAQADKYFLYVSDGEMIDYIRNNHRPLLYCKDYPFVINENFIERLSHTAINEINRRLDEPKAIDFVKARQINVKLTGKAVAREYQLILYNLP